MWVDSYDLLIYYYYLSIHDDIDEASKAFLL